MAQAGKTWRGLRTTIAVVVPALVVAIPPLAWVREATYRASLTTLGRDQGIFQYIAWAVMKGEVDYRDVRDVNGPLTHLVHMIFLALGGRDEHRFRVLDLTVTGISFAIVGFCLPGIARGVKGSVRPDTHWLERLAWAFAAWVALSGQLMMYLYWDLAQRESFFDWFLLPALGIQLVAQDKLRSSSGARGGVGWLVLSGALSAIPWFGKPTYVVFTAAQILALMIDRGLRLPWKKRLGLFAIGMTLGALTQIAFLLRYGDAARFFHISLHDVPAMYRFMMPRTPGEIIGLSWVGVTNGLAAVSSFVLLALIADGQIPRRAIAIALCPILGIASVVAQGKGFPYHFHPVSAGLTLVWLLLVVWAAERFGSRRGFVHRVVPFVAAAALSARIVSIEPASPHLVSPWILAKGDTAEKRAGEDYLVYFRGPDFFPWEMREAAAYLREHTLPDERVQQYGMDPYILFLAERLSATPYIYAYDLNADGALSGSWMPEGLHPTDAQALVIRGMRDDHEKDMMARLEKDPPAAFVFLDKAPLTTWQDSFYDFKMHNPIAGPWVEAHYTETASFGEARVFLRNDRARELSPEP
ncbi:hypothetical protein BH09MYX1_BH09MYX1_58580 [soil metagenome]